MNAVIHYDVLFYFYVPFIFLPLILGYIINRFSSKESKKIFFIPVFVLSFVPIFNIGVSFALCLIALCYIFDFIVCNLANNKILTKIINNFENRNI